MVLQTSTGRYEDLEHDAWGWFLANVIPTLSLLLGVNLKEGIREKKATTIPRYYFVISFWLSFFYLFLIGFIFFTYSSDQGKILDYYRRFNYALNAFQLLVPGSLGMFFIKKD